MKKGVQIRILDNSYISNTQFISLAEEVAEKCGIKYQESVRRGGSTNAAKISVTGKAVPCLVLGVPSRYAHSHSISVQRRTWRQQAQWQPMSFVL